MESVEPEPPQYCDIVMKGGITSGVVYPLAAVELAEVHGYSFRNVGGTSAGAIAAAAVAAAEFGRRSGSNPRSYERIEALPSELGTTLTSLFQPSGRMRPIFNTLLAGLGRGLPRKLIAPFRGFWLETLVGMAVGAFLIVTALNEGDAARPWALACGFIALLVLPCAAVASSAVLRLRGLPAHYFGICSGNDRGGDKKTPPLTRWLAELIDELAGKHGGVPLTFGDLWELKPGRGSDERGVDLQMMTTNLSQGRPYSLPFQEDEELWFDADEFLDLFPGSIVEHMVEHSPERIEVCDNKLLHRLPEPQHLPIVVAARMSLSFPLLIGAVPLYAPNDAPKVPSPIPERCWFSDGGITSNFPVHFFDSPIPRWPTFAINLMPLAPDRELSEEEGQNVWMPADNEEGVKEAWVGWEGKANRKQIFAFAGSIFRTAQNWIDNRQMRGAGHRDRIAHVRLAKKEGGMNLTMDAEDIGRLAARGRAAASKLAERFGPEPPATAKLTWDNQRWIRYRSYMDLLERRGLDARRGFRYTGLGTSLPDLSADPPDFPWREGPQSGLALPATWALMTLFWAWDAFDVEYSAGAPGPPTEPWAIPRV